MPEQYLDALALAEDLGRAALEGKRNERELREAIRAAVALVGRFQRGEYGLAPDCDAWLALPAVQSAIALEAADGGG